MPQFNSYTSVGSLNLADTILVYQGGAVLQATMTDVSTLIGDASRWTEISGSSYTSTPASDTSITMSDTSGVKAGLPIRVTQGGTLYYLIVHSVTANTSISVRGPALGATAITKLEIGKPEQVVELSLYVSGVYAAATSTTVMASIMDAYFRWRAGKAYMVQAGFLNGTADSTSAPRVDVLIAGTGAIADNSSAGVDVSSSATWNDSSSVESASYTIERGDAIELEVSVAGGAGDVADLTVSLTLILE